MGIIYDNPAGIQVPAGFLTVHSIGADVTYQPSEYLGDTQEPANYAVGGARLYGSVHPSESALTPMGPYNWAKFDKVMNKHRSSGVPQHFIFCNFNWPWQTAGYNGGGWTMSLPANKAHWEHWLTAYMDRNPDVAILEVANEVFTPGVGPGSFWQGSVQDLSTFSDWNLDFRDAYLAAGKRRLKVCAPSIPGFLGNNTPYINWLAGYPRRNEFDMVSAHFYYATWRTINQPAGNGNGWTCAQELRAGLNSIGMSHIPILDGEHGFGPGIDPDTLYNTVVYEATVMGFCGLSLFSTSQIAQNEAYIGAPCINANFRQALEDAARDVNGKRIKRVTDNGTGRFSIEYADAVPQTQVDWVTILPGDTTSSTPVTVTLSTPTVGATIRYTLDWTAPSATNGVTYSGPFQVGITTKVKAIALKTGLTPSVVKESMITIAAATAAAAPTFSPAPASYAVAQTVTLSTAPAGAQIRYTLDGAAPSPTQGTQYTGPFVVSSTATVRAVAYGANMTTSAISTGAYTITGLQKVATPHATPDNGTLQAPVTITLQTATEGAMLMYSFGTNPGNPATHGTLYAGPFNPPAGNFLQTLRVVAVKPGMANSDEYLTTYTILPEANPDLAAMVATEVNARLAVVLPGAVDAEVSRQLGDHLAGIVAAEVTRQLANSSGTGGVTVAQVQALVQAEVTAQLNAQFDARVLQVISNTPLHGQISLPLVVGVAP